MSVSLLTLVALACAIASVTLEDPFRIVGAVFATALMAGFFGAVASGSHGRTFARIGGGAMAVVALGGYTYAMWIYLNQL